jgi:hypothetical protein
MSSATDVTVARSQMRPSCVSSASAPFSKNTHTATGYSRICLPTRTCRTRS